MITERVAKEGNGFRVASKEIDVPKLGVLKMALRHVLRKFPEVHDIVIYDSYAKPDAGMDVVLLTEQRDLMLQARVMKEVGMEGIYVHQIGFREAYKHPLWLTLITEGFSIKENQFLRDMIGITPMKVYSYTLRQFDQIRKVQFIRALNETLKKLNGFKFGAGSILVPLREAPYFEEFLEYWKLNYESKEWTVF